MIFLDLGRFAKARISKPTGLELVALLLIIICVLLIIFLMHR
jgi:hypothetical protein